MNVATEHPAGRLRQLLAAVPTTSAPPIMADEVPSGRHCVVCHRGGNLGGHHDDGGRVVWIHKACHRRLHRRGEPARSKLSAYGASITSSSASAET